MVTASTELHFELLYKTIRKPFDLKSPCTRKDIHVRKSWNKIPAPKFVHQSIQFHVHGLPKFSLKRTFCGSIPRQIVFIIFRRRRAHSKKTWIWNVCVVNIIWFPAIKDNVGINLMKAFRIIDPTVLEQVTFCKKRLMETLLRMVLGLNVGMIGNHWYGSVPLTDDWKREVILFPVN